MSTKELVEFNADTYAEVLSPKAGDIIAIYGMVPPNTIIALRQAARKTHPDVVIVYMGGEARSEVVKKPWIEQLRKLHERTGPWFVTCPLGENCLICEKEKVDAEVSQKTSGD